MPNSDHHLQPIAARPRRRSIAGALLASTLVLGTASGCSEDDETMPRHPGTSDPTAYSSDSAAADVDGRTPHSEMPYGGAQASSANGSSVLLAQSQALAVATASIAPTEGNSATGTVRFQTQNNESPMLVSVQVSGLTPGQHGFHIHENGNCSAPNASSAGGHFNPLDTRHGGPQDTVHHVGDLGNLHADEQGRADVQLQVEHLAFSGPASILQKAVVIHAGPDDLKTDPSGKSGDRVGCGVIRQESAAR